MISKLSQHIAVGLARSSVIQDEDIELYTYGFYVLISKLLFLIISLILGVILNIVLESLVFYVSFSIIRAYAGGVHADKEWKCFLYTSVSIIMCALGIKLMSKYNSIALFLSMTFFPSLVIIILSPLDTEEKPLSVYEKEKYSLISDIIILIYILMLLVFKNIGVMGVCYSITLALSLESVLLFTGFIQECSKHQKKKGK